MAKGKAKVPPWRDRVLRLERVRASDLVANESNWRRHPLAQVEALKGVLSEVGFAGALLAYQDEGKLTLIDGHLRAGLDSEAEVPVLVLDVDKAEARKLLATYDPLGAMAAPDQDALLALLQTVSSQSQAVKDMLEALANGSYAPLMPMPNMEPEGLTDPDDMPEVLAESWVKQGDLFQLGEHRLMCGDSLKAEDVKRLLLGTIPGLMLTDPPYGVGYETDGTNPRWRHDNRPLVNDNLGIDQETFWLSAFAIWPLEGDCYIFSPSGPPIAALQRAITGAGIEHHQWLIWVKDRFALGRCHYHYRHEHIFYGWKGKSSWQGRRDEESTWEYPRPSESPEHPTMKPVALLERAIKNSSVLGASVADPFLGSGTTLIACEKLGRICYGMEIEPCYVQVALERWQNYTGQKAVKISDGNSHQD